MNNTNIHPVFEHNKEKYGIICVNNIELSHINKFKYFNLNIMSLLKKRIERKAENIKTFFIFNPEKMLFDGTPIDYKIILICKSLNNNNCSTYCRIIQEYFKDYIYKIYVDVDLLLSDFPEALYTEKELLEINKHNIQLPIINPNYSFLNKIDYNPSKIYDNLYLGDVYHSSNEKFIKEKNIRHILTLLEHPCELSKNKDYEYIRFKHVNISDKLSTNISEYFSECIEFIKQAHQSNETVYVHCAAGISRSVSIVIAFIMSEKNMTFNDALDYVKSCRSQAEPNMAFTCQLMQYEKKLNKC
jgi:protein-tyrosine phosphatase